MDDGDGAFGGAAVDGLLDEARRVEDFSAGARGDGDGLDTVGKALNGSAWLRGAAICSVDDGYDAGEVVPAGGEQGTRADFGVACDNVDDLPRKLVA